jgi:hypothetical protein
MMFRGAYTTEFYTALHAALHYELRELNGSTGTAAERDHLSRLWSRVVDLERTCLNSDSAALWTCS